MTQSHTITGICKTAKQLSTVGRTKSDSMTQSHTITFLIGGRQREYKPASFPRLAFSPNFAVVFFNKLFAKY